MCQGEGEVGDYHWVCQGDKRMKACLVVGEGRHCYWVCPDSCVSMRKMTVCQVEEEEGSCWVCQGVLNRMMRRVCQVVEGEE